LSKIFAWLLLILYDNIEHEWTVDIINAKHNKYIGATYMSSWNVVHKCNTYFSTINCTMFMQETWDIKWTSLIHSSYFYYFSLLFLLCWFFLPRYTHYFCDVVLPKKLLHGSSFLLHFLVTGFFLIFEFDLNQTSFH
jgi:hypothetical protein